MWLRKLVAVTMIITCLGMNALVLIGFFSPTSKKDALAVPADQSSSVQVPTVTVTAKPDAITAGNFSALTWETTNNPKECVASDSWSGVKTPFGAESTGKIATPGSYKYTLTCKNAAGSATATVTVAVGPANAPAPSAPKGNTAGGSSNGTSTATYCGGRTPCYSAAEIAKHGSSGNCWGWLGDKVINVSGFDSGYHVSRSGIANVQVGGVCGKNLMPSVSGQVGAGDYPSGHDHQLGAKSSSDANYQGYFVGFFDASKP